MLGERETEWDGVEEPMGESQTIKMDKQEVETKTMLMLRPCRQSQNLNFTFDFRGKLWGLFGFYSKMASGCDLALYKMSK